MNARIPPPSPAAPRDALVAAALPRFALHGARARFLSGSENLVFRVDAARAPGAPPEPFALRVYRPLRFVVRDIEGELRWTDALFRRAGLAVPAPVPGADGAWVQRVRAEGLAGRRSCVLLRWVPGVAVTAGLTPRHLEAVGAFMARLHGEGTPLARAEAVRPGRRLAHDYLDRLERFGGGPLLSGERLSSVVAGIPRLRAALARADAAGLDEGMLHGDLHQRNYLFSDDGVGALDFCACRWGPYLHDLAVTLADLRIDLDEAALPPLRDAFARGYASVRPLPHGWNAHLETFTAARTLAVLEWVCASPDAGRRPRDPAFVARALAYLERHPVP